MIKKLALTAILAGSLVATPAMAGEPNIARCQQFEKDLVVMFDEYASGVDTKETLSKFDTLMHMNAYVQLMGIGIEKDDVVSKEQYKFAFRVALSANCFTKAAKAIQLSRF